MHVKRLYIYFKHNLSITNCEQMVSETQQLIDEEMKVEHVDYVSNHE
jgi:hypothetical protein